MFFQERIGYSEDLIREDPVGALLMIWERQAAIIRGERAEKEAAQKAMAMATELIKELQERVEQ